MINSNNWTNPNNWSQDIYVQTHKFAAQAHLGQIITGTQIPYIAHLGFVAMEVIAAVGTDNQYDGNFAVQCALLHDTIEDTAVSYAQICEKFGQKVADGVQALTKDESLPKEQQIAESLQRIKQQPREVWLVKLADRISNLQPPPAHWTQDKIDLYRQDAMLIYEKLKSAHEGLGARLFNKASNYGSP